MPIRPGNVFQLEQGVEHSSRGYILVVDDEPDIRQLMNRVLRERGFSVLEAGDGEEALALIALHPIRLIVSNVRMPHMSGLSLHAELAKTCPALARRMIFCSGDITGEESYRFLQRTQAPWLAKPFDLDDLLELVHRHVGAAIQVDAFAARQIRTLLGQRREARSETLSMAWIGQA